MLELVLVINLLLNNMIHFYSDTTVFVFAPAGIVTGGSELLHQFIDILNNSGKDAYVIYYGNVEHKIADDYKKYNIKQTETFIDEPHNIAVLFEGNFDRIRSINKSQILLWWLSVDLMYKSSVKFLSLPDLFNFSPKLAAKTIAWRLKTLLRCKENQFVNNITIKELSRSNATNAYQAVYIQNYLYRHNFDNIISLSDYINTDFIDSRINHDKEDIILYNPRKGIEFTKKLIRASPDLKFVPIQNLTRQGVVDLMAKAKVYIDFGFHPGKDRLPREAALSGCVVITGKNGSAYYFEDVAIPSQYKYSTRASNIPIISRRIREVLINYTDACNDMQYYINKIKSEREIFYREIETIINL